MFVSSHQRYSPIYPQNGSSLNSPAFPRRAAVILAGLIVFLSVCGANAQNLINTVAGGNPGIGAALSVDIPGPVAAVTDAKGNLYVAAPFTQYIYQMTSGQVSVFAGLGYIADFSKANKATQSPLWNPSGLAADTQGNVYIADTGNNDVKKVDINGILTTVAGSSKPCPGGACGDGSLATSARLNGPQGVAVDRFGNIYIADTGDNRVRVVKASTGIILPYVSNWNVPTCKVSTDPCGDGGPPIKASLNNPMGIAVDKKGNVYVADSRDRRIREVSKGVINTVAGTGNLCAPPTGTCGDGGSPLSATMDSPRAVSIDASGNFYIADEGANRVRMVKVGSSPTIGTLAGTGVFGFNGDGVPNASELAGPNGVFVDRAGNVIISDTGNQRVRKVAGGATGTITTILGSGSGGDGAAAKAAILANPFAIAVDSANNYYVVDTANNRIREVNVTTGVINTVAGDGNAGYSGDGGPALAATLNNPLGVALDVSGNIYIADTSNHVVRCVVAVSGGCGGSADAVGSIITFAGNGQLCSPSNGSCGDGGQATSGNLTSPTSVSVDTSGNVFIADAAAAKVREVSNGIITTVAGTGDAGDKGDFGPATAALLDGPTSIAVDGSDNIYIADSQNDQIRCVLGTVGGCGDTQQKNKAGWIIPYAFNGCGARCGFQGDGVQALKASRWNPTQVAVDAGGNLFIGGGNVELVQRVDLATGIIVTVVGVDAQWYFYGFRGDGGLATHAHIDNSGLTIDSNQNLLIADAGNNRIRQVPLISVATRTPGTLNFGNVTVGQQSPPQTSTLQNTGSNDMLITNLTTSGDFTESDNCPRSPSPLAPSVSCTIKVTFTPTRKGKQVGFVTITDNGYKSPQSIRLTGTGQ